jgi:uncharacterized protein (TIGR00266 family)
MQIDLVNRPAATAAVIRMQSGERFVAEPGSMIAMSTGLALHTDTRGGGLMGGIKRMFSGESFFLNTYEAQRDGQELLLAPTLLGDIEILPLQTGRLLVQRGAWLGSSDTVTCKTTNQGLTVGLFGGQGLFWIECTGHGQVLVSTFGALYVVDVDGEYVVDTSHVVAHEETLQLKIGKANESLLGSFVGGEGLVCKFNGRGRLWVQSHNPTDFGKTVGPLLPPRQN